MSTHESPNSQEEEVLEKVRKFYVALSTMLLKVIQNYLDIANERKQEGNDCFRAGKWNEALVAYRSALNSLPKRPTKSRPDTSELDETPGEDPSTKPERKGSDDEREQEPVVDVSSPAVTESEKESVRLRSVLNANVGACFVKLVSASVDQQKYSILIPQGQRVITKKPSKLVLKVLTLSIPLELSIDRGCAAILDDPTYIKALERRAASNEILNTWTSLTTVQEGQSDSTLSLTSSQNICRLQHTPQTLHITPTVE
jgi:hypothetical protein